MLDVPELLARVVADPDPHLGRKSLPLWRSYLRGYRTACDSLGRPHPHDPLDRDRFQRWIEKRVPMRNEHVTQLTASSCVSPATYAELMADDEAEALDRFVALRAEARAELPAAPKPKPAEKRPPIARTALDLVAEIRERPEKHFGGGWCLGYLWATFSGYVWCERDHGIENSKTKSTLDEFQTWMEERYPFGRGRSWDKIIRFLRLRSPEWSFDSFVEHLEMFRSGEPPTAEDPAIKRLADYIQKRAEENKNKE